MVPSVNLVKDHVLIALLVTAVIMEQPTYQPLVILDSLAMEVKLSAFLVQLVGTCIYLSVAVYM